MKLLTDISISIIITLTVVGWFTYLLIGAIEKEAEIEENKEIIFLQREGSL